MEKFEAGNVSYYPYQWVNGTGDDETTYYGLFVKVPSSMMIIEMMSNASSHLANASALEPRMSQGHKKRVLQCYFNSGVFERSHMCQENRIRRTRP